MKIREFDANHAVIAMNEEVRLLRRLQPPIWKISDEALEAFEAPDLYVFLRCGHEGFLCDA